MPVTRTHIAIGFGICCLVGAVLLIVFYYQRRKGKTVDDIKTRVQTNTKPDKALFYAGQHVVSSPFYGTQKVVQDSKGIWRIAPGVCTFTETGIIDWEAIKAMPQLERDTLFVELGECKLVNVPLLQPA